MSQPFERPRWSWRATLRRGGVGTVERDNRQDLRSAQQALVHAGYPAVEAWTALATFIRKVRSAAAARRAAILAGFTTGALMAVSVLAVLGVGIGLLGLLMRAGFGDTPGTTGDSAAAATAVAQRATEEPAPTTSPLEAAVALLRASAVAAPIVGVAGLGLALVDRARWRRAGALSTFLDLRPTRLWMLREAAVWALVAVGVAGLIGLQLGDQARLGFLLLMIPIGIPSAAAAGVWFRRLYPHVLPRMAMVDAAALARPIIVRDAALQVVADREFYGRNVYRRQHVDRSLWADQALRAVKVSETDRRHAVEARIQRRSGGYGHGVPLRSRLPRYALAVLVIAIAIWSFVRWGAWMQLVPFTPFRENAGLDIAALIAGAVVGGVLVYIYARYLEDV